MYLPSVCLLSTYLCLLRTYLLPICLQGQEVVSSRSRKWCPPGAGSGVRSFYTFSKLLLCVCVCLRKWCGNKGKVLDFKTRLVSLRRRRLKFWWALYGKLVVTGDAQPVQYLYRGWECCTAMPVHLRQRGNAEQFVARCDFCTNRSRK